jgi:hypothetical protein
MPAYAQDDATTWPSVEACHSAFRAEPIDGDEGDERRAGALIARLRDPGASYGLTFRSRNTRHGGLFVDGEPADTDVLALQLDMLGSAVVERPDHLAFIGSFESRWSYAEMRRDDELRVRFGLEDRGWGSDSTGGSTTTRLPDALARVKTATPVALDGHWYEVTTSADLGPGSMWDSTREVFEVIEDVETRLLIETDDDGTPVMACLWQAWWQGDVGIPEDTVIGEDASLASAVRIDHVGSAPALPPKSWPIELVQVDELDIEVAVPIGAEVNRRDGRFWAWLGDKGSLPRLRASRMRVPDSGLGALRSMWPEDVLEAIAQEYATSARSGWDVDPLTVEYAWIGGADGTEPVPARLLTYIPELDDGETYAAIDVVTYLEPWIYHFQLLASIDDQVASRYLLERTLEGTRFLCSEGDDAACPASD